MTTAPAIAVDCEWGYRQGRVGCESAFQPVIFCARKLSSGEEFSFEPGDGRLASFIATHHDHIFIAHSATAEMKYLLRADIPLPPLWWDTQVGFKSVHNRSGFLSATLVTALTESGLSHLIPPNKDEIRNKILALNFRPPDMPEIRQYCLADVIAAGSLYQALVSRVDPTAMGYWCEYLKAVSKMELRGVPTDLKSLWRIWNHRIYLAECMQDEVNATAPIYEKGVFKRGVFLAWAKEQGIEWPTAIGAAGRYHPLDKDAFKEMEYRHPFIMTVKETRKSIATLTEDSFTVDGQTGRHYFSTMPFRSVTGRNQPPGDFIFAGAKMMRWLVVPPDKESVLIYVDYKAQEIGIAAALSGDAAMKRMYRRKDPHAAFAEMAGGEGRDKYKTVNLGVLYAQTEYGIADRLGISVHEAKALLKQHRTLFSTFHDWSKRYVSAVYQNGYATTKAGWRANVDPDTNWRTWANFPVQASAADAMRLFTIALDRQGISIHAIVHDGWLLSCRRGEVAEVKRAIRRANVAVCTKLFDGFKLRLDVKVYSDRFRDEKGEKMWGYIQDKLPEEGLYAPCE